eukprot:13266868-Alexandrium_andersonii.AAC.1
MQPTARSAPAKVQRDALTEQQAQGLVDGVLHEALACKAACGPGPPRRTPGQEQPRPDRGHG